MSLLPEMWPLAKVAKELGKASHVLVDASRRGEFPPLVRVGATWYVKADACREWFERQHVDPGLTPAQLEQVRHAGRAIAPDGNPMPRRRNRR